MSILRKDVNSILIKIKNGDKASANDLFNMTYNHLKVIAYPYVRNKNDVEDVVVEAYLRIYRYINTFDYKQDGYNWMCKIIQNTAYDWNKKYIQEMSLDDLNGNVPSIDIEETIALQDEVRRLLQGYSKQDQQMMYMRFWGNKTMKEIAEALKMSKSNIHKRISKILDEILEKNKL